MDPCTYGPWVVPPQRRGQSETSGSCFICLLERDFHIRQPPALGDTHDLVLIFVSCYNPVDRLHPGRPCPAGRWLRTSTLLGCADPLDHHLQKSFKGKPTHSKAAAVAAGRASLSASDMRIFYCI